MVAAVRHTRSAPACTWQTCTCSDRAIRWSHAQWLRWDWVSTVVHTHGVFQCEGVRAQAALEGLLPRMSPQMSRERMLLPESLSARAALKGPLSRVDSQVKLEVISTGEGLSADRTPVLGAASGRCAL